MGYKRYVIILAAGKGSRMQSDLPKPLHQIGGRPMLGHVIEVASQLNPEETHVVVAPDDLLTTSYVEPVFTVVQPQPNGTGGAVRHAIDDIEASHGTLLVLYGDAPLIAEASLIQLLKEHDARKHAVTVMSFMTNQPGNYGRLVIDEQNTLRKIVEAKDASEDELKIELCNGGVMAIDISRVRPLFDQLCTSNSAGELYLTDLVAESVNKGWKCGYIVREEQETLGANDHAELVILESVFQKRMRSAALKKGVTLRDPDTVTFCWDTVLETNTTVEPHVVFGPGVHVKTGATIRSFSHLEHSTVNQGAVIGPYARLRPGTVIGKDAKIGNFVEIKNSNISIGAKISHLSYIGDADIGQSVNIGAGTITCNYDGYLKYRTSIGDGAFIGSNTSLIAPVNIGEGALVGAGSTISRDVPSQSLAVVRGKETVKPNGSLAFRNQRERNPLYLLKTNQH